MSHAIVYRFEGFSPKEMKAMQRHHQRSGGDLEHCDPTRFHMNEIIHGTHDWADDFLTEVTTYKELNMRNEVAALRKKGRKKEANRRHNLGGVDPWKSSGTLGPVRGIVLTANAEWFRHDGFSDFEGADFRDPEKVKAFRDAAVEFLDKHIPREHCLFMIYETDERAPHIHAYYRAWNEKETKTKGVQRMLQPTDMHHFRNAEKAQDLVAEHFAPLGLVRGKKTAEERRRAKREGRVPPQKRQHITPAEWRRQERLTLIQAADQARAEKAKAAAEIARLEKVRIKEEKAKRERVEQIRRDIETARAEDKVRADQEAQERKERERAAAEREAALAAREAELEQKERSLGERISALFDLGDKMKAAAQMLKIQHPVIQAGLAAFEELRVKFGGRQRVK